MNDLKHVLIIPDGNRRWAKNRGLLAFLGHEEGAKRFEEILNTSLDLSISNTTFWASSLDNITKRPKEEVDFLFRLFKKMFEKILTDEGITKRGVRVNVIGRWRELFPEPLRELGEKVIERTKHNKNFRLTLLMAYSGTDEMTETIKRIAGEKKPNEITEDVVKKYLWTHDLPPVDLVLRTGGEPHLSSGLMMWDIANSHLYFTETLWPDFKEEEFKKAVADFKGTERRLGK